MDFLNGEWVMENISNVSVSLPLELLQDDVSVLLMNIDYVPFKGFNCMYYTVNKDNTIPYNIENELANSMIEKFISEMFDKSVEK